MQRKDSMLEAIILGLSAILSLILIWMVQGMFKKEPPFGAAADYIIGLIAGVGVTALDYWVFIPWIFGSGAATWLRAGVALLEGVGCAWLILWIIRQVAGPKKKSSDA